MASAFVITSARQVGAPRREEDSEKSLEVGGAALRALRLEDRKKSEVSRLRLKASAFVKTSARQVGVPRRTEEGGQKTEDGEQRERGNRRSRKKRRT